MAKPPSDDKVREYDETRRFCRVVLYIQRKVAEHSGEVGAHLLPEDLPDFWREKKVPFGQALKSVLMLCRDLLEATQDYQGEELAVWDGALASQRAPTLSTMRVKHWKLVPKIVKRGRIRNEEEYYLVKSVVDSSALSDDEQAKLVELLDQYGFKKE